VVGGELKGRRLVAPPGDRTRPTSDRVRESIFNALWSRGALDDGTTVLDLFAGSGALGIEALSRGAVHATFVDESAAARRAVTENLRTCGLTHRATVVADRAERFLADAAHPYDLVFCDPPYAFAGWVELLAGLARLPAGLVVIEAASEIAVTDGWEVVRATQYGTTWVGFVEPTPPDPAHPAGET
jgi:16S rRNA (guanine966-N2)-methyltransferase